MPEWPSFPDDFPSNCPPQDAIDANGLYYRIVNNNPPTSDDFLSKHELGAIPKYRAGQSFLCRWRALSLYASIGDAEHHRDVMPGDGEFIAEGQLVREMGRTKLTPNPDRMSHTEWWCYHGIVRHLAFRVI